uniref:Uncharacterized protein n=1 Tax=Rhizophora mucronata TaxID=61149 RepID=A0A2P2J0X7_RHIMU
MLRKHLTVLQWVLIIFCSLAFA